jgi:hypothetical protein
MKDLSNAIELVVGMKVLVTSIIKTGLDLAHGFPGETTDIMLEPEEPPVGDHPSCICK